MPEQMMFTTLRALPRKSIVPAIASCRPSLCELHAYFSKKLIAVSLLPMWKCTGSSSSSQVAHSGSHTGLAGDVPHDVGAVALNREDLGVEIGERPAQVAPALHDLSHRLHGPEAEIEAGRTFSAAGDAGNEAVLPPRIELEARDGARDWSLRQ